MYLLGVKKVQICPFKGIAPATSCCTPKGTILNTYFSVCMVRDRFGGCDVYSLLIFHKGNYTEEERHKKLLTCNK